MSTQIIIMGRTTKPPVIQQAQNTGAEYISLDLAVSQWNQKDRHEETIFYKCFFNSYQAQKLIKANVKQGSTLQIIGNLTLQPFIYQKGERAGQPDSGARIEVYDWQYTLSNKPENADAGGSAPTQGMANGGVPNGGYQNQGYANQANYAAQNSGYGNAPAPNMAQGQPPQNQQAQQQSQNRQSQNYQQTANGYQGMPAGNAYANDGFTNVPEGMAQQLPFPA
ncbi:MAG: single-stranded DNA-binding protein [Lachnospiraceae bacterium]|nr:single-stranded DNA-binding protein [Lachnospiraceae bacterium]